MAAEESRSLVFTYDLKRQTIFVDEQTARTFGVAEVQPDVPYGMVGRGIVSEDTVDEYIRIHEEILNGGLQAEGIVKLITVDGTLSVQKLKFEMIMDAEGKPSGTAVGIYRDITGQYQNEKELRRYQRLDYVIQAMKNDYLGIFELDLVKERYCVLHCGKKHSFPLPMEGDYKELPDLTGIRILLAEDNDLNGEIAKELLEHLGAEVKRAANGREAVQMFEASAQGYYDLIFMDIQMPKMNGYEAVRQIRRLERTDAGRVPVIAMTANAFAEDVKAALGAGMNGHLAKPADLHRMAEAAVSSVQRGTADAS